MLQRVELHVHLVVATTCNVTRLLEFDLEHLRPVLTCHVDGLRRRIVGDAVKHVHGWRTLRIGDDSCAVDDAYHIPIGRIDAKDLHRSPNIRPDLALNPFQLVELSDN